jgi:hypothetical protein
MFINKHFDFTNSHPRSISSLIELLFANPSFLVTAGVVLVVAVVVEELPQYHELRPKCTVSYSF